MDAEFFDREPETLGKADERSSLPIEQKESFRWLQGYRRACELAAECPQTQIVSVADREADIYDIFVEAQQQPVDTQQPLDTQQQWCRVRGVFGTHHHHAEDMVCSEDSTHPT